MAPTAAHSIREHSCVRVLNETPCITLYAPRVVFFTKITFPNTIYYHRVLHNICCRHNTYTRTNFLRTRNNARRLGVHVETLVVRAVYDVVLLLVTGHVHATGDLGRVDETTLVRQRSFVQLPGQRGQHQHLPQHGRVVNHCIIHTKTRT